MKKYFLALFLFSFISSYAQFKDELNKIQDIRKGITNNNLPSMIFGFINPDNFSMHHSFSMSYCSFGNNGIALGVYTNSMAYKFNDQFDIQVDASIVNSPYNSFGDNYASQINGVYLSRAQINYRPADNFFISVQYSQMPMNYYNPWYMSNSFNGYSRQANNSIEK